MQVNLLMGSCRKARNARARPITVVVVKGQSSIEFTADPLLDGDWDMIRKVNLQHGDGRHRVMVPHGEMLMTPWRRQMYAL